MNNKKSKKNIGHEWLAPSFWKNTSIALKSFISFIIICVGLILISYFVKEFGVYSPSILIPISVLVLIVGGPYMGFATMISTIIFSDYFFIEPRGKMFSSNESIIRSGVSLVVISFTSFLIYSINKSKEEALQAKVIADKVKEEALQAKAAADQAIKDRDEMIGVISHELKNPLTNMQLSTGLLLKVLPQNPELDKARKIIEKINPSIERMSRLMSDLLDVTRIEAKSLKVDLGIASLDKIANDIAEFFTPSLLEKNIKLKTTIPHDCAEVFCDSDRTIQILTNLVNNAIKFTESGGQISIRAKKNGSMV